jgi:hypothetical protein
VAHLEDNDFITLSDTEYITISLPAAGDDNFIKNTRVLDPRKQSEVIRPPAATG